MQSHEYVLTDDNPEWESFRRRLIGYFRKCVDDSTDVEDLTSQTLLQSFEAHRRQGLTTPEERLVFKIARRRLMDFYRKNGLRRNRVDLEVVAENFYKSILRPTEQSVITNEERNLIEAAMVRLSKLDRAQLALYLAGYTDEEIVQELGLDIAPETVGKRRSGLMPVLRSHIALILQQRK